MSINTGIKMYNDDIDNILVSQFMKAIWNTRNDSNSIIYVNCNLVAFYAD